MSVVKLGVGLWQLCARVGFHEVEEGDANREAVIHLVFEHLKLAAREGPTPSKRPEMASGWAYVRPSICPLTALFEIFTALFELTALLELTALFQ